MKKTQKFKNKPSGKPYDSYRNAVENRKSDEITVYDEREEKFYNIKKSNFRKRRNKWAHARA